MQVLPRLFHLQEAAGVIAANYQSTDEVNVSEVQEILKARGVQLHLDDVYRTREI